MIVVRYNMVAIIRSTNIILPAKTSGQSGIFYAGIDDLYILLPQFMMTERMKL